MMQILTQQGLAKKAKNVISTIPNMKHVLVESCYFSRLYSGTINNPAARDMVTSAAGRDDKEYLKFLLNDLFPNVYKEEIDEVISMNAIKKAAEHNHPECLSLILNFLVDSKNTQLKGIDVVWKNYIGYINSINYDKEDKGEKDKHEQKNIYQANVALLQNKDLELKFFAEICCAMIQNNSTPNRECIPEGRKGVFDYIALWDHKKETQSDFIENLYKKCGLQDNEQEDQVEIPGGEEGASAGFTKSFLSTAVRLWTWSKEETVKVKKVAPIVFEFITEFFLTDKSNPIFRDMVTSAAARDDKLILKFLLNELIPNLYKEKIAEVISMDAIKKASKHGHMECCSSIVEFLNKEEVTQIQGGSLFGCLIYSPEASKSEKEIRSSLSSQDSMSGSSHKEAEPDEGHHAFTGEGIETDILGTNEDM